VYEDGTIEDLDIYYATHTYTELVEQIESWYRLGTWDLTWLEEPTKTDGVKGV